MKAIIVNSKQKEFMKWLYIKEWIQHLRIKCKIHCISLNKIILTSKERVEI